MFPIDASGLQADCSSWIGVIVGGWVCIYLMNQANSGNGCSNEDWGQSHKHCLWWNWPGFCNWLVSFCL